MNEERRMILEMLQEGAISVEEAERLMEALPAEESRQLTTAAPARAGVSPKRVVVLVTENGKQKVNVRVPFSLGAGRAQDGQIDRRDQPQKRQGRPARRSRRLTSSTTSTSTSCSPALTTARSPCPTRSSTWTTRIRATRCAWCSNRRRRTGTDKPGAGPPRGAGAGFISAAPMGPGMDRYAAQWRAFQEIRARRALRRGAWPRSGFCGRPWPAPSPSPGRAPWRR